MNFRFPVIITVLACMFLCLSCNRDYKQTKSGLKYKFIEDKDGPVPVTGDRMVMHILYKTKTDSVLFDSKVKGDTFSVLLVDPTFAGGVEEGFAMMSPGDSALFTISADSLFEKTFHSQLPSYLNKGSEILFQVRLKSIRSKAESDAIRQANDLKFRKEEFKKLDYYLDKNKLDVMPTDNGAYVSIIKPGSGPYAEPGDTMVMLYTGRMLDGTIFDESNDRKNPFVFVLGVDQAIKGWEEAMPLMQKGSVAKIVMPSDLAYGGEPYRKLPPYSSLAFDVEVLDIRKGNRNAD